MFLTHPIPLPIFGESAGGKGNGQRVTDSFAEIPKVHLFRHEPGRDKYDAEALQTVVSNFSGEGTKGRIFEVHGEALNNPVVLGHNDEPFPVKPGTPAHGWISKIWSEGRDLFGSLTRVSKDLAAAINNGAYRHGSAEFYPNYKGNLGPAIRRFAVLGGDIPARKTLGELAVQTYSEGGLDFDRITWYTEDAEMKTVEEQLAEAQKENERLTKEIADNAALQAEKDEKVAGTLADMESKLAEATKEDPAEEDKFAEQGKTLKALKALTDVQRKEIAELQSVKIEDAADKFAENFVRSKNIHIVDAREKIRDAFIKMETDSFGEEESRVSVFQELLNTLVVANPEGAGASRGDANTGASEEQEKREYDAWSETWAEMGEEPVSFEDYQKFMK